ncbi:histidine kinase [Pedobacter sp. PAMC26386]|nr:histidine kinase [Pedobacter sp. PAMC26386]
MKNNKIISIHLLGWALLLIYTLVGQLMTKEKIDIMYLGYSIYVVHLVEFYICYLWVLPNSLKKGGALRLIVGLCLTMAAFIALRYLIEEVLFPKFLGFRNYGIDTTAFYYIIDNLYFGTSYIVFAVAVWSVERAFFSERVNKQLKEEAVKAELAFLKSQINPHFLYNTLNYIYSLAIPVSDQLASAVLRLSDLMRYTLTENADGKVSLVKEVEYLQSYIELFRMRFEPNFYVEFERIGVNEQQRIASLLLIPFIENAFKHGVLNKQEQPVHILLQVVGKDLKFVVNNTINNHQKDKSSGIGLVNIQRRMELIYPDKYQLDIHRDGNTFQTTLIIKLY